MYVSDTQATHLKLYTYVLGIFYPKLFFVKGKDFSSIMLVLFLVESVKG